MSHTTDTTDTTDTIASVATAGAAVAQRGISRRGFVMGSGSAAAGGLMLGFHVPAIPQAGVPTEVNAWVVIKPDDTVIVRIAQSMRR